MKKIPQESSNLIAANRQNLKQIFPEIFCEDQIDFQTLKQLLGEKIIDDQTQEKYGLNWSGKSQARQFALSTSLATLRPKKSDSVNWQNTKNLMIEGDNLEVLKLLQKSYAAKIKMIYIDPPYNTGKDFVYPDDYAQSIQNYKKISGQTDEQGFRNQTNQESSGRFHTAWLNMIYPRLKLARNLLTPDGVIFISIDDHEVANLRHLMNEVFGDDSVDSIIWQKMDARYDKNTNAKVINRFKEIHEYLLIGYRNSKKDHFLSKIKKLPDWNKEAKNPDKDARGGYEAGIISYEEGHENEDRNSEFYYSIILPSGRVMTRHFFVKKEEFENLCANNRIYFPKDGDGVPRLKIFQNEEQEYKLDSILRGFGTTQTAKNEVENIFGIREIFDTPKPIKMLKELIRASTKPNDIILDFFAGSGTTAQAVMELNQEEINKKAQDKLVKNDEKQVGNRRFILVQLPEILDEKNKEQKAAAEFCDKLNKPKNIAELTKERLRRAGEKIKKQNPLFASDLGFRCFALDESNIKPWQIDEEDIEKSLEENCDQLLLERSDDDILCEVFLKNGLDLSCQILSKKLPTKSGELEIFADETASQIVCLTKDLNLETAEELAIAIVKWHQELTLNAAKNHNCNLVFRDSAFLDDVVKANFLAILNQAGFTQINSL